MTSRKLDVTEEQWKSLEYRTAKLEEARREARLAPGIPVVIRLKVGKLYLEQAKIIYHARRPLGRFLPPTKRFGLPDD